MNIKNIIKLGLVLTLFGASQGYSEDKYKLEALWPLHVKAMNDKRLIVDGLLKAHAGVNLRGKLSDIGNMQRLLDQHIVNTKDVATLQAMGIALGDVFVKELNMHWVIYEDKLGRSKALQYRDSQHFLFPSTMISRRAAGGADINIQAIYDKSAEKMQPYINSGPFIYYDK